MRRKVDEAVKTATTDPELPPNALYADLYANTEPQLVRGAVVEETLVQPHLYTADIVSAMGRAPKK